MALLVNLINEHKNANKCKRRKTKMDTAHSKQRIKNILKEIYTESKAK